MTKLDANPYLMCFNNYVIDFKAKTHRKGKPDDYISKSTNIDYIHGDDLTTNNYSLILQEVNKFIDELTPEQSIYVITQAASYGFKRGIFNLQESEVLSKSLRVFNQIQKPEE